MAEPAHTPTLSRRHFMRQACAVAATVAVVGSGIEAEPSNDPEALFNALRRFGVTVEIISGTADRFQFVEDNCNENCFVRASKAGIVQEVKDNRAAVAAYLRSLEA